MPLVFFRRELLAFATALPVMGCSLNTEGLPGGNDTNNDTNNETNTDTPQVPPFDHKVILNLVSVQSLERAFTLHITYNADVTGVGPRAHSPPPLENDPANPNQTLTLPFAVGDDSVIALGEAGTVSCKCKFVYNTGEEEEVPLGGNTVDHVKVADQPLDEFSLSFASPDYVLT